MAERDDDLLGSKQGHGFNAPLNIKMHNRDASRLVEETEDFLFKQREGIPNVFDLLDLIEGREKNRGFDPLGNFYGRPGIGKTPGNVRRKYSTKPDSGPYDYTLEDRPGDPYVARKKDYDEAYASMKKRPMPQHAKSFKHFDAEMNALTGGYYPPEPSNFRREHHWGRGYLESDSVKPSGFDALHVARSAPGWMSINGKKVEMQSPWPGKGPEDSISGGPPTASGWPVWNWPSQTGRGAGGGQIPIPQAMHYDHINIPGADPHDYSRPFSRPFPQASREFKDIWRLSQQGLSREQFIEQRMADEKKYHADQLEQRRRSHAGVSAFRHPSDPPTRQLPGLKSFWPGSE
jgi:hypothetical protein